jgi:HEAT repeat protein
LVRIGSPALPALRDALKEDDPLTRVNAAWALWEIQGVADEILPTVLQAWWDRDHSNRDDCVRRDATELLIAIAEVRQERVLPELVRGFVADDQELEIQAAIGLAALGKRSPEAVTALMEALRDRRESVRKLARGRLRAIGSASVGPLLAAQSSEDPGLRSEAAICLQSMKVSDALPALTTALGDQDPQRRVNATRAIGAIGPPAKAAKPTLERMLGDHNEDVRRAARDALERLNATDSGSN